MNCTVTKNDSIGMGYGPSFSSDIIRRAKFLMVQNGYSYYSSRRLGRVPIHSVESVLGYTIAAQDE